MTSGDHNPSEADLRAHLDREAGYTSDVLAAAEVLANTKVGGNFVPYYAWILMEQKHLSLLDALAWSIYDWVDEEKINLLIDRDFNPINGGILLHLLDASADGVSGHWTENDWYAIEVLTEGLYPRDLIAYGAAVSTSRDEYKDLLRKWRSGELDLEQLRLLYALGD